MNMKLKISVLLVVSLLVLSLAACSANPSASVSADPPVASASDSGTVPASPADPSAATVNPGPGSTLIGATAAEADKDLTVQEMLTYAIQDEYLAHAEYEYILDRFGDQRPFNNIIKAEEQHISLLIPLLKKYGADVPADTAQDTVPHPEDLRVAFETGVQAEIDNIAMYDNFLKLQLPEDVKTVFTQLRDASKSHLTAFERGVR